MSLLHAGGAEMVCGGAQQTSRVYSQTHYTRSTSPCMDISSLQRPSHIIRANMQLRSKRAADRARSSEPWPSLSVSQQQYQLKSLRGLEWFPRFWLVRLEWMVSAFVQIDTLMRITHVTICLAR